jgi:hypothetical protein
MQRTAMRSCEEDPSRASTEAVERWQRLLDLGVVKSLVRGKTVEYRQKSFDEMFQKRFEELKAYKAEHGMFQRIDLASLLRLRLFFSQQCLSLTQVTSTCQRRI